MSVSRLADYIYISYCCRMIHLSNNLLITIFIYIDKQWHHNVIIIAHRPFSRYLIAHTITDEYNKYLCLSVIVSINSGVKKWWLITLSLYIGLIFNKNKKICNWPSTPAWKKVSSTVLYIECNNLAIWTNLHNIHIGILTKKIYH